MKWINVKDSLPAYEHRVLGFAKRYRGLPREIAVVYRSMTNYSGEHWMIDEGSCGCGHALTDVDDDGDQVSHWLPLPESPGFIGGK